MPARDLKMIYLIHFEHADGTDDSFAVEGKTIEQISAAAIAGVQARNGQNPWSELLEA
jgi:hypothetical protein